MYKCDNDNDDDFELMTLMVMMVMTATMMEVKMFILVHVYKSNPCKRCPLSQFILNVPTSKHTFTYIYTYVSMHLYVCEARSHFVFFIYFFKYVPIQRMTDEPVFTVSSKLWQAQEASLFKPKGRRLFQHLYIHTQTHLQHTHEQLTE